MHSQYGVIEHCYDISQASIILLKTQTSMASLPLGVRILCQFV